MKINRKAYRKKKKEKPSIGVYTHTHTHTHNAHMAFSSGRVEYKTVLEMAVNYRIYHN